MSMRPPRKSSSRLNLYYRWYVLSACFFLLFFQAGARFSFGIMFKPMISQFGWDRASISMAYFLNMVFFALTLSIAGRVYDRFGPKWVILTSSLFLSAGYSCISFIDTLWEFYFYYGILAAIGTGGASIPLIAAMMSKWFEENRGLVISLALSGNCIGQFVLVPVFSDVVLAYGWRVSYLVIGLVILVVNTTLVLLVINREPEDPRVKTNVHERLPDTTRVNESGISKSDNRDLNLKEAMKTSPFWLFLIVMFVCGSGDFLVTTHLVPMVTDFKISPGVAADMLAWFGLLSMGGMLIAGPISDRMGNKVPIALTFVLRLVLFLIILHHQNLVTFYVFAIMFGFTFLITAPLTTTLVGKLYGFSHVGLISGFITMIHHLGGGCWAYLGGLIFDNTGSYYWSFIISAGMAGIAVICTLLLKERRYPV